MNNQDQQRALLKMSQQLQSKGLNAGISEDYITMGILRGQVDDDLVKQAGLTDYIQSIKDAPDITDYQGNKISSEEAIKKWGFQGYNELTSSSRGDKIKRNDQWVSPSSSSSSSSSSSDPRPQAYSSSPQPSAPALKIEQQASEDPIAGDTTYKSEDPTYQIGKSGTTEREVVFSYDDVYGLTPKKSEPETKEEKLFTTEDVYGLKPKSKADLEREAKQARWYSDEEQAYASEQGAYQSLTGSQERAEEIKRINEKAIRDAEDLNIFQNRRMRSDLGLNIEEGRESGEKYTWNNWREDSPTADDYRDILAKGNPWLRPKEPPPPPSKYTYIDENNKQVTFVNDGDLTELETMIVNAQTKQDFDNTYGQGTYEIFQALTLDEDEKKELVERDALQGFAQRKDNYTQEYRLLDSEAQIDRESIYKAMGVDTDTIKGEPDINVMLQGFVVDEEVIKEIKKRNEEEEAKIQKKLKEELDKYDYDKDKKLQVYNQGAIADTITEIFSFGSGRTKTYNKEDLQKEYDELKVSLTRTYNGAEEGANAQGMTLEMNLDEFLTASLGTKDQDSWVANQIESTGSAPKVVGDFAMNMVPIVGTVKTWRETNSIGLTLLSAGLDVLTVVPIVNAGALAVRAGKPATEGLLMGVKAEVVGTLKAPYTIARYPLKVLKKGVYEPIEMAVNPNRLPMGAVTTNVSTSRIPIKQLVDEADGVKLDYDPNAPTRALELRNEVVTKALNNQEAVAKMDGYEVTVEKAPLLEKTAVVATHATASIDKFYKSFSGELATKADDLRTLANAQENVGKVLKQQGDENYLAKLVEAQKLRDGADELMEQANRIKGTSDDWSFEVFPSGEQLNQFYNPSGVATTFSKQSALGIGGDAGGAILIGGDDAFKLFNVGEDTLKAVDFKVDFETGVKSYSKVPDKDPFWAGTAEVEAGLPVGTKMPVASDHVFARDLDGQLISMPIFGTKIPLLTKYGLKFDGLKADVKRLFSSQGKEVRIKQGQIDDLNDLVKRNEELIASQKQEAVDLLQKAKKTSNETEKANLQSQADAKLDQVKQAEGVVDDAEKVLQANDIDDLYWDARATAKIADDLYLEAKILRIEASKLEDGAVKTRLLKESDAIKEKADTLIDRANFQNRRASDTQARASAYAVPEVIESTWTESVANNRIRSQQEQENIKRKDKAKFQLLTSAMKRIDDEYEGLGFKRGEIKTDLSNYVARDFLDDESYERYLDEMGKSVEINEDWDWDGFRFQGESVLPQRAVTEPTGGIRGSESTVRRTELETTDPDVTTTRRVADAEEVQQQTPEIRRIEEDAETDEGRPPRRSGVQEGSGDGVPRRLGDYQGVDDGVEGVRVRREGDISDDPDLTTPRRTGRENLIPETPTTGRLRRQGDGDDEPVEVQREYDEREDISTRIDPPDLKRGGGQRGEQPTPRKGDKIDIEKPKKRTGTAVKDEKKSKQAGKRYPVEVGWKQGFGYRIYNLETDESKFTLDRPNWIPEIKGKGSAEESFTVNTFDNDPPSQKELDMGIVKTIMSKNLGFRSKKSPKKRKV